MRAGKEKRQEMMQNLFGESNEEVDSDQEAIQHSASLSDEEEEGEFGGEGQAEIEGEGEAEAELESEGERADGEPEKEESEGERYRSSPEREISGQRMVSEGKEAESDAEEYDRREATSRRHVVSASVSEGSREHKGLEDGAEEVEQVRELSDSLRLATLLVEMKEGLDLVRSKVQLLVQKVKENYYCTKDGMSYLDVKYLLLLSYCQSIVYYLLRKAEGSSIQGHPVTKYLVEIRLFLEKIRPIDKKHQYLIEKLSRVDANLSTQETASKNEDNFNIHQEDALKYRPNPDMLVSKLDPVAQDGEGIYRPPMFAPTAMDEEKNARDKKLQIRKQKEMLHKASRSAFVKELANDLEGKPDEVREIVGAESKEMLREQSKLVERARQEEELFTRVPLSRIEKKKIKHLKRSRNGLLGLMDDFNDDISGLIAMEKNDGIDNHPHRQTGRGKRFKKRKVKH